MERAEKTRKTEGMPHSMESINRIKRITSTHGRMKS